MAQRAPLLEVKHLVMRFGGLTAVNDLSFQANPGDITALIGPNGAGKTTVFNCITGFYRPSEGSIHLAAPEPSAPPLDLARMADFRIARDARVARTFQNIRLFAGMTVLENLLVAQHKDLMAASGWSIKGLIGARSYRQAEAAAIERARQWLDRVGLIARADDPAGSLPYGGQRRLEIARAMCTGPRLLCLDEPAAGLNPKESAELTQLLRWLKTEAGVAILLIEHDMSVVMEISDHIVVLDYGRRIADGPPAAIRNNPDVIKAYLGVEDAVLPPAANGGAA